MTDLYLVDKSALARADRQPTVLSALGKLDQAGILLTSPLIELEIGYSTRNLTEFDAVAASRREFYRELPLTPMIAERAKQVQRELVRQGRHRGAGVPDLLIAATAESFGAVVVHYDRDFEVIASVTGQPVRWIVPAGSVP